MHLVGSSYIKQIIYVFYFTLFYLQYFCTHTHQIWSTVVHNIRRLQLHYIAHLPQQCHNSKSVIFQEKRLKVLKCYNFLWVQRRHNCSPAASFANCVMTLYLLNVHLQTLLSIRVTQKCQSLSCDTTDSLDICSSS